MPLLDEQEEKRIFELIKRDRETDSQDKCESVSLEESESLKHTPSELEAIALYQEWTGIRLNSVLEFYVLLGRNYGALCPECGKPFRTPRAKLCAACGYELPEGQLAGSLLEDSASLSKSINAD